VAKTWEGHPPGTLGLDFDGNLERYVRVDHLKNVASVRRVADDGEVCRITEFARSMDQLPVLSPDGQFLGRIDRTGCKVWKVTSQGAELLVEEPGVLGFSPDSRRLALARQDGAISIYDLPSGKQLKHWHAGVSLQMQNWPFSHCDLAFHPQKPQLAVSNSGKITVFELDSGNKLAEFAAPGGRLEWHPGGKRLATAEPDRCISLWDASTGKSLGRLMGHNNDRIVMAIHPTGNLLASTCWDGMLRLWDMETEREIFKTSWNSDHLHCLHFSRDGRLLAADVADHQLRLWNVIPASGYQTLVREPHLPQEEYFGCAVSPKHPLLAVGMEHGLGLWELRGGRPLAFLPVGPYQGVAFEPSGALLTFGVGVQRRWPIVAVGPSGALRIGPPQPLPFPASPHAVAANRDGRVTASAQGWGGLVRHPDRGDKLILLKPQYDVRSVAVSPDGDWIATGSHSTTDVYVKVWEARTGRHITDLPVQSGSLVGFSPDGRWLLTTGGGCRLWEVGTWREGPKIGGALGAFAFSPDGKVLAVETGTGAIRLVDPDSGHEYARLEDPNQDRAHNLAFSPDGSQLFASTKDSPAVHAWDLRAIRAELAERGLDWDLPPYPPAAEPKGPPLQVKVDLGHLVPYHKQADELNKQAWPLATNPDAKLRDPARAVELAQKAVDLCPKQAMYWNTLGVAHYSAGHWKEAIEALTKSMQLQKGNLESFDTFFLAMAHWRLDEKEKARQWYDRAVQWMEKNKDQLGNKQWLEELRRFRAEAEELLGIQERNN
jgi:WD40 repeat protein